MMISYIMLNMQSVVSILGKSLVNYSDKVQASQPHINYHMRAFRPPWKPPKKKQAPMTLSLVPKNSLHHEIAQQIMSLFSNEKPQEQLHCYQVQ